LLKCAVSGTALFHFETLLRWLVGTLMFEKYGSRAWDSLRESCGFEGHLTSLLILPATLTCVVQGHCVWLYTLCAVQS
jgi:hypothetical protein